MSVEPWRQRLRDEITRTKRPLSDIAKQAKLGTNFVEHFMKEEQRTSVEKVLALCAAIDADPAYIFGNVKATPELKRLLELADVLPEERVLALIQLLDPK